MKRISAIVAGRWFLSLIGALSLALLLWLLGPLSSWLEGVSVRLVGVLLILAVWLVANLLIGLAARRADKKMISEIANAPADREALARQAASEEIGLLRERLEEALEELRRTSGKSRWGRRYLFELPWYMLIGPPGSGKTTALRNSGLQFPLAEKFGRDPVRGAGGTRNCDWWLSEDAVLLDTAGRYTTQESDHAVDQKAWLGFLDLLRTYRPRQPINGAIVAIGLPELATMSEPERQAHARAIRARLGELRERFGLRFPVYVLLAKLDLIAGFVEFFDDLDRQGREQVWGMTFPLEAKNDQAGAAAALEGEFDRLLARLNARLLDRLNNEADAGRRALIYGFPSQLASLKRPLADFVQAIFAPSRYEKRVLLRGVYFSSATQEGTPIDRLMAAISEEFAIDRQRLPAFSGAGRGYFLTRLMKEVVFGEASLVGTDPERDWRRRWGRRGAYGALALAVVALLALWGWSYLGNRALIAGVAGAAAQYQAAVRPFDGVPARDDDLAPILPVLDAARALPTGYDDRAHPVPLNVSFGLYQGRKLGSVAVEAYRHALDRLLLPRLALGVRNQLAANLGNPDLTNALLEAYLMLGQQGPLNRDLIKRTVDAIWGGRSYAGMDQATARTHLEAHVDALLSQPLEQVALDAGIIDQARTVVSQVPLASRAYRAILDSPAAQGLPTWRLVDHAGPAADQVLARISGKPLTDGVPGIYTRDGFRQVLLPQAPLAVKAVAEDTWVLGPKYRVQLASDRFPALINETIDLYLKDYIRQWDALLGDIRVVPLTSNAAARDAISTLSGPASPLRWLLTAAAEETTLVEPSKPDAKAAVQGAQAALASPTRALDALAGGTVSAAAPSLGKAVDDHFQPLHAMVAGIATGQSQLDDLLKRFAELGSALSSPAGTGASPTQRGGAGSAAAAQLALLGPKLPAPLNSVVGGVAAGSAGLSAGDMRKAVSDLYLSSVLPLCRQALDGRYPADRNSAVDVSLGDFASLFRPGGVIDGFFETNLRPYVDTTRSPWRNQKVDNVDLGLSPQALQEFERARAIRDAFFAAGSQALSASFVVEPLTLAAKAAQVELDVNGQSLTYAHGPTVPTAMAWPGPDNAQRARLAFTELAGGATPGITLAGPWAWFRLLDKATISGALPDQFTAAFKLSGLSADFKVRAASVHNPFRGSELAGFHCAGAL